MTIYGFNTWLNWRETESDLLGLVGNWEPLKSQLTEYTSCFHKNVQCASWGQLILIKVNTSSKPKTLTHGSYLLQRNWGRCHMMFYIIQRKTQIYHNKCWVNKFYYTHFDDVMSLQRCITWLLLWKASTWKMRVALSKVWEVMQCPICAHIPLSNNCCFELCPWCQCLLCLRTMQDANCVLYLIEVNITLLIKWLKQASIETTFR